MKRVTLFVIVSMALAACGQGAEIASPTPVLSGLTVAPLEVTFEAPKTPTPEPFRLTLPSPPSEPISVWRPPLYPIPWAMSPYDHFYFARPIAADQINWPLADYRYGGVFFAPNIVHTGIDIDAEEGAPVFAAGPGTIVWAGWGLFRETPGDETDPYGLAVAIRHDFGFKGQQLYTIYAHMSGILAVLGQRVETGEQIGLVGATGAVTGPHLHFEVRFPDNSFHSTYNPELWIAPPQGWGVLVGRVLNEDEITIPQIEVIVRSEATRETRIVKSYGGGATNSDPYYNENVALGDLPAGIYKITIQYRMDTKEKQPPADPITYQTWVEIFPGQVTFFTFTGGVGFDLTRPPAPTLNNLPSP